jgi:hypothetical protein
MKVAIYSPMSTPDVARAHYAGGWQNWGFNPPAQWVADAPWDAWFELHDLDIHWHRRPGYLEWLAQTPVPVYLQNRHEDYPTSSTFPADDIARAFSRGWYHCGSVDWLVSFAILSGAERIALHGMSYGRGEPESARACLEYWCGFAEGRGITVESSDEQPILINASRSGFDSWETTRDRYGYEIANWLGDHEYTR